MHLTCPVCASEAVPQLPPRDAPPDGPIAHTHLDGTSVCPAPGRPQWPSWPDVHNPPIAPHTIPSDTVAIPRRHPCRLLGAPIPAQPATATVIDRDGGIDCPATAASGGCPYVTSALSHLDNGGLAAGGGCWLRALAPHQAILALHRAGVALPHRTPGFAHDHHAATVLTYTRAWLDFAADTGGGLRTARLTHTHPRRANRAAPTSAPAPGRDGRA